jgi:hypothetical protein
MLKAILKWLQGLLSAPSGTAPPGTSPFAPGSGPARLLIMRHGEKTNVEGDIHLSPEGQQRAQSLVTYIPQNFGTPDFFVAAADSENSRRPRETLEPLAAALGTNIHARLNEKDQDGLVEHLTKTKFAGKLGVISWRHGQIPKICAALGAPNGSYPADWPEGVFNLIIEMTFAESAPPRVRQIVEPF